MAECPTICNADLRVDLMASFTNVDLTNVDDSTCNTKLYLTDDAGLNDVNVGAASGTWLQAASPRVRVVASLQEVAAHYAVTSDVYKAADEYFSNVGERGVAPYYYLGFWDRANETAVQALDAINDCNPCWRHLVLGHADTTGTSLIAGAHVPAVVDWAITNEKIPHLIDADPDTKDPANTTNLKAQLFASGLGDAMVYYTEGYCRQSTDPATGEFLTFPVGTPVVDHLGDPVIDPATGVQRISDGTDIRIELVIPHLEMLAAGWAANVDHSQSGQDYSLAYKPIGGQGWIGVPVDALTNGDVTGVTGIFVDGTINPNNNGHANVYVQSNGIRGMFRGMTVGGSYLDHLHLKLYARGEIRSAIAQLMANNRKIPYDDARGKQKIATAIEGPLSTLQANGYLTQDEQDWEKSGAYIRKGTGYVIRSDNFIDQTPARKNSRRAPQIQACMIPAGGTEHVPITLCTLAQPQAV